MAKLNFSDGMSIETDGDLRIIHKSDGMYVVGNGMLISIDSPEEGESVMADMQKYAKKPESSAGIASRELQPHIGSSEIYDEEDDNPAKAHETFESFITSSEEPIITEENSLKDLVGKGEEEELDLDDARTIGKKISKMKGDDRKKFIGIVNFMGASCRIYNEIWANYKPVDPSKKKSNKGKEYRGDKEVG